MEDKKSFGKMLSGFFAGKGFYIALLLCAGLIATSIWLVTDKSGTDVESVTDKKIEGTDTASMRREITKEKIAAAVEAMNEFDAGDELPEAEAPAVKMQLNEPEATETVAADYFIWPVQGETERGFSVETLSYDRTMSDWRIHDAVDIAAEPGTPVLAAGAGRVMAVYEDVMLGTAVEIDHGSGVTSLYANLMATPVVKVGDTVNVGDTIGAVGSTALAENAEVSHLHFAMSENGVPADPARWMPEK